jgi:hypothetical protein
VWIISGALVLILIIGAVFIFPRLPKIGSRPGDGAPGVGAVGTGPGQASPDPVGATPGASGGPTGPGASASPGPTVPPGDVPLRVAGFRAVRKAGVDLPLLPSLLGWEVTITIHNPASFAQAWTNVSVTVDGGMDLVVAPFPGGLRVYDAGGLICAEPTDPDSAMIPAGSDTTIQFDVRSRTQPSDPEVDDDDCKPR